MTELPPGWVRIRLDEISEVRLGRQRSPKNHNGTQMRPYLRAANVTWDGISLVDVKRMNFTNEEMDVFGLLPGDLLLSEASGSASEVGKPAIWNHDFDEPIGFQNTLLRVRPSDPGVSSEYLRWRLLHECLSGGFVARSRGVGIHHLGAGNLAALEVELPPVQEQRRLVEAVETYETGMAPLIAGVQRLETLLRSFRRAALREAFGSVTSFRPLAEVVEVLDHKRVPVSAAERATRPGKVPYYGAAGRVGSIDSALFNETLLLLGEDGIQFFDPDKQKSYIISGPSWVNNHAHVLRPGAECDVRYLKHYLDAFDYEGFANGTTRLKLTKGAMLRIPVPNLKLADQREVAARLDEHLTSSMQATRDLGVVRRRLDLLRRVVLRAAFEGRLTTPVPGDEAAADLLTRIKQSRAEAPPVARRARKRTVATMAHTDRETA